MHRKKVGSFGESIDNYPDGVMLLRCVGKTNDEIHTNIFRLP
jgi:hypothetical protein